MDMNKHLPAARSALLALICLPAASCVGPGYYPPAGAAYDDGYYDGGAAYVDGYAPVPGPRVYREPVPRYDRSHPYYREPYRSGPGIAFGGVVHSRSDHDDHDDHKHKSSKSQPHPQPTAQKHSGPPQQKSGMFAGRGGPPGGQSRPGSQPPGGIRRDDDDRKPSSHSKKDDDKKRHH